MAHSIFYVDFRKYQNDMLGVFEEKRKKDERKFHFVAPPGSGKTIIGIELIVRLGEQAVIFSPNQAIQSQWIQRIRDFTSNLSVSSNPEGDEDVLSLTYQIISTKNSNSDELHVNAKQIISRLKKRRTVILDECHHLTAWWAEILKRLTSSSNTVVIGLTATPPFDKTNKEVQTYIDLVGDVDYEILLPPVIKEGYLAPYQDLIYITEPDHTEIELINRLCEPYNQIMKKLLSDISITPIHFWAESRLIEYRDDSGTIVPFDELLIDHKDLCIALVRFVSKHVGELPYSVIMIPEMDKPINFNDIIHVIEDYVRHYLYNAHKPYYIELKEALAKLGYQLTVRGIKSLPGGIKSILSLSRSKMISLKEIIKTELLYMQDDLRVLVLTDFELEKKQNGTSAIEVMQILTSDPETDPCDPILLTGNTVLIDDDLLEDFLVSTEVFFEVENINVSIEYKKVEGFYEISSPSSMWNTKTYVRLITYLLEKGVTRCLISTRSLLGEGWDSIKLNTLVDLTVVSSFAYVNQIRGRTIRMDESNKFKTSNNWDIMTIFDNEEHGLYDYYRVERKFNQFFGISEDSVIEKGIGHVSPLLSEGNCRRIIDNREKINSLTFHRAKDRLALYQHWEIGKTYKNKVVFCVEIKKKEHNDMAFIEAESIDIGIEIYKKKVSKFRKFFLITGLVGLLIAINIFTLKAVAITLAVVSGTFLAVSLFGKFIAKFFFRGDVKEIISQSKTIEFIKKIGKAVFLTLKETGETVDDAGIDKVKYIIREDGTWRIFCEDEKVAQDFALALKDCLSGLQDQKYIIKQKEYFINDALNWLKTALRKKTIKPESHLRYFPVPDVFSGNKNKAKKYCNNFVEIFGEACLMSARDKTGKEIVKNNFRKKILDLDCRIKEIWV
ncbi:MAG: DEAD/DEAH box helicase family protein [Spirochaetales bacterium]|nr:DEAD/DEAH box helicase family protein [Spirochaetales bacterium]